MTIITSDRYTPAINEYPLAHARILHPGVWVDDGTVVASNGASGTIDAAPNNDLTYDRWQNAAGTSSWGVTFGASRQIDCMGIAAHTLGSASVTFSVQARVSSAWVDIIAGATVEDDASIMAFFPKVTCDGARILITTGQARLGVVRFGEAMVVPQRIYSDQTPFLGNRDTTFQTTFSRTGEILGLLTRRVISAATFNWRHITAKWVRDNWYPAQRAMEGRTCFIAWRPDRFQDVAYGNVEGVSPASNMGIQDLMQFGMEMSVYTHE